MTPGPLLFNSAFFFRVFVPFKLGFAVADRERQATGSKWLCKTAPVTILKGVFQIPFLML